MTYQSLRYYAFRIGVVLLAVAGGFGLNEWIGHQPSPTVKVDGATSATQLRNQVVVDAKAGAPVPPVDALARKHGMDGVCDEADNSDVCRAAVELFALGAHNVAPFSGAAATATCSDQGTGRIDNFHIRYTRDKSCMPYTVSVSVPVERDDDEKTVRIARFRLIDPVNNQPRFRAEWGLGFDDDVKAAFLEAVGQHYESQVKQDRQRVQRVERALGLPGDTKPADDSVKTSTASKP